MEGHASPWKATPQQGERIGITGELPPPEGVVLGRHQGSAENVLQSCSRGREPGDWKRDTALAGPAVPELTACSC